MAEANAGPADGRSPLPVQEERMRDDPRGNARPSEPRGGRTTGGAAGRPLTRRDFLGTGAAAGAALYLAACGGSGSSSTSATKLSGGPVTLNNLFMQQAGYSPQDLASMTRAFEKAYPKIKITNTLVPYDAL